MWCNFKSKRRIKKITCSYCGADFIIDDESEKHIYIKRDEAAIKRAENEKEVELGKIEFEKEKINVKKKNDIRNIIFIISIFLVAFLIIGCFITGGERKSIKQENELQQLVDEIMIDVENNQFDEAYIKAQSIKYTAGWSSEIEEKWNNTRIEVINTIIKKEKEATGKSNHKPEKKGFFNNLFK